MSLSTGDGQHNRNTRQYRNKTVCIGCTERTLAVSVFCYSFVYTYSAGVNALQTVFSNSSYESTAK